MQASATRRQRELIHRLFVGGRRTSPPGAATEGVRGTRAVAVVTRRRVKAGCAVQFEVALRSFMAFALAFPGHLDVHVLRRTKGDVEEFAIANRFVDAEARTGFTSSWEYRGWLQDLRALTVVVPLDLR